MEGSRRRLEFDDNFWLRRWMRSLCAVALTIVLGVSIGAPTAHAVVNSTSTSRPGYHIFLIRGFMNIFSLGMDQIAAKLRKEGIHATVANHLEWPALAQEAAAEYKSGRVRTIILVGHSWGAAAVTEMADRLGQLGVPVKLAIGLDPVFQETASGHVGRYVNYYISNGAGVPVTRSRQYRGVLDNVDVKKIPGIGHFNIDKNQALQRKVIEQIHAALYSDHDVSPTRQSQRSPGAQSSNRGSAAKQHIATQSKH